MSIQVYRRLSGAWKAAGRNPVVPQTPPFWGCAFTGNSVPSPIEDLAGRPVGVRRTYWTDSQVTSSVNTATADVAAHRVPWVSYGVSDSWANVAAGSKDSVWNSAAAQLGALNGPVMVTVVHEPETKIDAANGNRYPEDFIAMQNRVGAIFQAYSNIKYGPIIILSNSIKTPSNYPSLDQLWPGTFPHHFLGFDSYNYYGTTANGKWFFMGPTRWKPAADWCKTKGTAWAVGEFGISASAAAYNRSITGGSSDGVSGGDITWLREAYDTAVQLGTTTAPCLALAFFSSGLNSKSNQQTAGGINPVPVSLIGKAAWPLVTQVYNGTTYGADEGTPSKGDVFVDILKKSPAWRSAW